MATAVQITPLPDTRDTPFTKLVLSQASVRRVKAGISVEDIGWRSLLQNLNVRPVVHGQETGMFRVPAGPTAGDPCPCEAAGEDGARAQQRMDDAAFGAPRANTGRR